MKAGKTVHYFEGQISDGTTSMRMVGFEKAQNDKLTTYYEQKLPITLEDCQVQKSHFSGGSLEILLKRSTKFLTSPKNIDNTTIPVLVPMPTVSLGDLADIEEYQHVSVAAKVLRVDNQIEVKPGLYNQDSTIADSTGTARLTLWQENINKLEEKKSYELKNLIVRSFNQSKYLTLAKFEYGITCVEDITDVKEELDILHGHTEQNEIIAAEIVAVSNLMQCRSCTACQSRVDVVNERIGRCSNSRCSAIQRLDKCSKSMSANLLICCDGCMPQRNFKAFLPMIKAIADDDTINEDADPDKVCESLLMAAPFNFTYMYNTITSVYRSN